MSGNVIFGVGITLGVGWTMSAAVMFVRAWKKAAASGEVDDKEELAFATFCLIVAAVAAVVVGAVCFGWQYVIDAAQPGNPEGRDHETARVIAHALQIFVIVVGAVVGGVLLWIGRRATTHPDKGFPRFEDPRTAKRLTLAGTLVLVLTSVGAVYFFFKG